jgi:formamidopyrimidine-DNA glycosylase
MPELPEVQTTVDGINRTVRGRTITDVWTEYKSAHKMHKGSIKEPLFFKQFKKKVIGEKILRAERRAKNILIHLSGNHTILMHMKMTGHLMYGTYEFNTKQNKWTPVDKGPLKDPFNAHLRLIFSLDNKKHLAFSDVRKFGKVTIDDTNEISSSLHLKHLGPEPLDKTFTAELFIDRINKKTKGKVKSILMDQTVVAGIGNIYSDEMLWLSNVHPLSIVSKIPEKNMKLMYIAMKEVLNKGIDFGGDSTSDYRNIKGERGTFQAAHNAYKMNKTKCKKRGCPGILERLIVGGRSAHFCPVHQKLFI